jgi:hypothetical protein
MPKQNVFKNVTTLDVMCASIEVYKSQGFIKSGHGYTDNKDPENPINIDDNKTMINSLLSSKNLKFSEQTVEEASNLINSINGKLMLKKMTNTLNNFETNVVKALSEADVNKFSISIIASLPHSVGIDKKREEVADRMSSLKHSSQYFGTKGKRFDIDVQVLDVKFIQTSNVYMISSCYAEKDIVKFWWRDQPDISDIIANKTIKIRATVNKHELSKYTGAKETMVNRVKILSII